MSDDSRSSDPFADSAGWLPGGYLPEPRVTAPPWWAHIHRDDLPENGPPGADLWIDEPTHLLQNVPEAPIEGLPSRRSAWTINLVVLLAVILTVAVAVGLASAGTAMQAVLVASPVSVAFVIAWVALRRR